MPPSADAPWQPVQLPDNWLLSHAGDTQVGWYRLPFDLAPEVARSTHTLYLPRNSARRMDFFVNRLRQGGNRGYGDPGARNWSPPLTSTLSSQLLKPGRNVLHVRVEAVPELRLGPRGLPLAARRLYAAGVLPRPARLHAAFRLRRADARALLARRGQALAACRSGAMGLHAGRPGPRMASQRRPPGHGHHVLER